MLPSISWARSLRIAARISFRSSYSAALRNCAGETGRMVGRGVWFRVPHAPLLTQPRPHQHGQLLNITHRLQLYSQASQGSPLLGLPLLRAVGTSRIITPTPHGLVIGGVDGGRCRHWVSRPWQGSMSLRIASGYTGTEPRGRV